jgi:hypothetical protein
MRSPCILLLLPALAGLLGAEETHWSFRPLAPGPVPDLRGDTWSRTPVDGFILRKLEAAKLRPQVEADRYTLLRRVTADLTGLPPSPEEVEAFVSDPASDAYEKLVDRLLERPQFGERWARHWLDVARYGETDGILTVNEDKPRKDTWRYRDAVIHALNEDLPFDIFVRYQLVDAPESQAVRYGALKQFIHLGTRLQNNADPNDRQWHRLDDMVSTTGNAFLAFTFGCARCHDHPVDPMSTREYYQLTAVFFDDVREPGITKKKRIPIRITRPHLLKKGSWQSPGEPVEPGFLDVLMRQPIDHGQDGEPRKALADWLTDVENGAGVLLARVVVNRLWQHHFGQGLVKTPNDFGTLGSRPSHPRLLDWLAAELIANGWRLKPLHRLMVTSASYRQSDTLDPAARTIDTDNTLLWHWRPRRLDGEAIRDRLLHVSGALNPEMYGPSLSIGGYKKYVPDGPDQWRRSIYLQAHRTVRHPTLGLFDPPDSERSTGARSTGATPEGALFALNAPLVWQLAEHVAQAVQEEAGTEAQAQVGYLYRRALSRDPLPGELEIGLQFLREKGEQSLVQYAHLIFALNEFIYIH